MNPKRFVIVGSMAACLMLSGLIALADDVSIAMQIGNLKSNDEAVRVQAIDQLAAEGTKSAEAVAPLQDLLKDASATVRAHSASALGAIGAAAKPAVPALIELLKDSDATVRRQAVKAMMKIHPGPQVMVPLFVQSLEDSDPGVRMRILHAISDAGPAAVPGLIAALENDKTAYWVCLVLRDMGPAAKAAVPALTEKLKDPRPEIRREAILALAAMEFAATPAAEPIAAALKDEQTAVAATYALGRIGRLPEDAESVVRANTKNADNMLSTTSYWTLARVHPEDKQLRIEVTERLIDRLKDSDPLVRVAAARALAALPPAPEITATIWEKAFSNCDETTVLHALDALAMLGPTGVPELIEALKFEKARSPVVYVLGRIGPPAAPATQALAKLIDDKDDCLANDAILAIANIGPGAKDAVPALMEAIKREGDVHARTVVYALGKIGPDAVAAVPLLFDLMKGSDRSVVMESAWALANIQPASAEVATKTIPVLMAGLSDNTPLIRTGAAEALGILGPLASEALPALQKAMNDDDKSVRDAAAKAVHQIRNVTEK
jgi:HEAT repeat protein